jgi:hypothetical protein
MLKTEICLSFNRSSKRKIDHSSINRTSSEFSRLENESETVYDRPVELIAEIENYLRSTTSSGYAIPRQGSQEEYSPIYSNVNPVSPPHSYIDVEVSDQSEHDGHLHLDQSTAGSARERVGRFEFTRNKPRSLRDSDYINGIAKLHSYIEVLGDGTLPVSLSSTTSSGYCRPMDNTVKQLMAILENQARGTTQIGTH